MKAPVNTVAVTYGESVTLFVLTGAGDPRLNEKDRPAGGLQVLLDVPEQQF